MQILAFALGVTQILAFLDTNKLGSKPTRGPNASVFALQWNIGFTYVVRLHYMGHLTGTNVPVISDFISEVLNGR